MVILWCDRGKEYRYVEIDANLGSGQLEYAELTEAGRAPRANPNPSYIGV
jgi:hypothetical protein